MPYIRLNQNGEREYLEEAPKYFYDNGVPVDDEWLITNENVYPVVDQDISKETDVVDIIVKDIDDWEIDTNNFIKSVWVVKDIPPEDCDDFYQYAELNDESKWKKTTEYIHRTYTVKTYSLDEVKTRLRDELKEKRYKIETGGYLFYDESENEIKIETNRVSQIRLANYCMFDGSIDLNWKTYGKFITLKSDDIKKLNTYLQNFIKECFDNEARIYTLIENAVDYIELKNIYDDEFDLGWPEESIYLETGE